MVLLLEVLLGVVCFHNVLVYLVIGILHNLVQDVLSKKQGPDILYGLGRLCLLRQLLWFDHYVFRTAPPGGGYLIGPSNVPPRSAALLVCGDLYDIPTKNFCINMENNLKLYYENPLNPEQHTL